MKDFLKQCINFKVNVWRPLVAFVFLGSILTGCVDSTDNPVDPGQETATGDDASDKMPCGLHRRRRFPENARAPQEP